MTSRSNPSLPLMGKRAERRGVSGERQSWTPAQAPRPLGPSATSFPPRLPGPPASAAWWPVWDGPATQVGRPWAQIRAQLLQAKDGRPAAFLFGDAHVSHRDVRAFCGI